LDSWAIPARILEAAPESPWGFPPRLFRFEGKSADVSPSSRRALEALPRAGTVLDVGVGAGSGSLPLASRAASITGVDESEDMIAAFRAAAGRYGIEHHTVLGRWPEVAPDAGTADVVVAHHVIYNVRDLASFCLALTEAARRRVVLEGTERHPAVELNPLWKHFHDLERPQGPTVEDALAVLTDVGIEPETENWTRPERD
jgi:SAM-dependent methyltransferase